MNYSGTSFALFDSFWDGHDYIGYNLNGNAITVYEANEQPTYNFIDLPNIYSNRNVILLYFFTYDRTGNFDGTKFKATIYAEVDIDVMPKIAQDLLLPPIYIPYTTKYNHIKYIEHKTRFMRDIKNQLDKLCEDEWAKLDTNQHISKSYNNVKSSLRFDVMTAFSKTNFGDIYSTEIDYKGLITSHALITSDVLQMQYNGYKQLYKDTPFIMLVLYKYDYIKDSLYIVGSTTETDRESILDKIIEIDKINIISDSIVEIYQDVVDEMKAKGELGFYHYISNELNINNLISIEKQIHDSMSYKCEAKYDIIRKYVSLKNECDRLTNAPAYQNDINFLMSYIKPTTSITDVVNFIESNFDISIDRENIQEILKTEQQNRKIIYEENTSNGACRRARPVVSSNKNVENIFNEDNPFKNMDIQQKIKYWIEHTNFKDFCNAIKERVIGQPEVESVLVIIWTYLKGISTGNISEETRSKRNNTIITAPSGTGKTETYRALKEYFSNEIPELPVILLDSTKVTSEGFRGKDTNEWLKPMIKAQTKGISIVFLDEFDKLLRPKFTSRDNNVSEDIQGQLLMVLEGTEFEGVNTLNTLFIGIGSFDYMREYKKQQNKDKANAIGFNTTETELIDSYDKITIEDMRKSGALNELLGRFPIVINYGKLHEDAIRIIINKFKDTIEKSFNIVIQIADDFMEYLIKEASGELGLRNIYNIMLQKVLPIYRQFLLNNKENYIIILTADKDVEDLLVKTALTDEESYEDLVGNNDIIELEAIDDNDADIILPVPTN